METTTIKIDRKLYNRLARFGIYGDSINSILSRVLEVAEEAKQKDGAEVEKD